MRIDVGVGSIAAAVRETNAYARAWERVATAKGKAGSIAADAPPVGGNGGVAASVGRGNRPDAGPRFIQGPEQRLLRIVDQRKMLGSVTDTARRTAITKDLDRAEFLAKRSIHLQDRRKGQGVEGPGLLELFTELNKLMRGLSSGNVLGSVKALGLGVQMLKHPGGLNIQQRLASSGGGPSLSDFAGVIGTATAAAPAVGAGVEGAAAFEGIAATAGTTFGAMIAEAFTGPLAGPLIALTAVVVGAVIAFQAVSAAVKFFSDGVRQAVDNLQSLNQSRIMMGGSLGQAGQLQAFGINPGLAASFREHTAAGADPFGQMGRAQLGLAPVLGGPLGPANQSSDLLQAIEALHGFGEKFGVAAQTRTARMAGLESALPIAQASGSVFGEFKKDTQARSFLDDPQLGQDLTDLKAQASRLFGNISAGFMAFAKPIIKPLGDFFGSLANGARALVPFMGSLGKIPGAAFKIFTTAGKIFEHLFVNFAGQSGGLDKLIDSVTEAMLSFARSLPYVAMALGDVLKSVGNVVSWVNPKKGAEMMGFGADLRKAAEQTINDLDTAASDSDALLKRNNDQLERLNKNMERAGTFGGGPNARGALGPTALRDARDRVAMEQALGLGVWLLG